MLKITEKKLRRIIKEEAAKVMIEMSGGGRKRRKKPSHRDALRPDSPFKGKEDEHDGQGPGEGGKCNKEECTNNDGTIGDPPGIRQRAYSPCIGKEREYLAKYRQRFIEVFKEIGVNWQAMDVMT